MIIPVRCFTCNKVIANKWLEYKKKLEENNIKDNDNQEEIFKELEIHRYCCKRMFLGHVDMMDKI
jgi:DNA-directed RNA polymerase subunit N